MSDLPDLAVVIVTYAAEEVIVACLDSLFASEGVRLEVVVVDNASPDATVAEIQAIHCPQPHRLRLIEAGANGGFAAGVNIGLAEVPDASRVWLLNPDCRVQPRTALAFAIHPDGFGLLGGRVLYEGTSTIQTDGGTLDRRTGVTHNIHQGLSADTPPPDPMGMDFVSGANVVASRAFLDEVGPMPEEFFLYYEEVAWAFARGTFLIDYCAGGTVSHAAGHSIGSGRPDREPSPLSLWFLHRNRQRFAARELGRYLVPRLWTFLKALQALGRGQARSAAVLLRVALGLPAPRSVRSRVPDGFA